MRRRSSERRNDVGIGQAFSTNTFMNRPCLKLALLGAEQSVGVSRSHRYAQSIGLRRTNNLRSSKLLFYTSSIVARPSVRSLCITLTQLHPKSEYERDSRGTWQLEQQSKASFPFALSSSSFSTTPIETPLALKLCIICFSSVDIVLEIDELLAVLRIRIPI